MKTKRTYTMSSRARSVEQTRSRIVGALFELSSVRMFDEISLEAVAAKAGVSVQTVLRHFGSRDGLIEATVAATVELADKERVASAGDVGEALRVLIDQYELRGRWALLMLSQEETNEHVAKITAAGKRSHDEWLRQALGPLIGEDRELLPLLVVATDVYAWKLLRLDRKMSREQTEKHMNRLVRALLADVKGDSR
jgi:AcrR family transcriptional regulator